LKLFPCILISGQTFPLAQQATGSHTHFLNKKLTLAGVMQHSTKITEQFFLKIYTTIKDNQWVS